MKSSIRLNSTVLALSCMGTALLLWLFLSLGHEYVPYTCISSTKVIDTTSAAAAGTESVSDQKLIVDATLDHIPNVAHYVYIPANASSDFSFAFSEVLSIYLHTNAPAEALVRANSGAAGKWTRLLFHVPNLRIATVEVLTHAHNGKEIKLMEHKSDFVRVQTLRRHGGVYLDFDVHPLRDIRPLRESGFHAVAGRHQGDNAEINSGVFMNKAHSKMIELWSEGMNEAFTGEWSAHSNGALTAVCEHLIADPGEVLIMERNAFAPGSWMEDDTIRLMQVHDDETSSLDMMTSDGHLPQYEDERMTRWPVRKRRPEWAQNWSRTYMLHAFNHNQGDFKIPGFERITPRYILERRSNMARAVYPVARDLFKNGLIDLEDPYKFYLDQDVVGAEHVATNEAEQ